MKNDLFEMLTTAIMIDKPFLLVEGKDDVQIYHRIANIADKSIDIYPVSTIEEYGAGCDNVIKAMHKLQPKFDEREDNIQRVLGIVDRDARIYRTLGETDINHNLLKGLFILKYYSIETYFATKNNLKKVTKKLTHATSDMITDDIISTVESSFYQIQNELFYISLEALKNACTRDYDAVLGYNDEGVKDNNRRIQLYNQLANKKESLDAFATELSLSIENLKLICKGKWLLHYYTNKAEEKIKQLSTMCRASEISQCKSCLAQNYNECYYKYKIGYIYDDILEYIDADECQDIIDKFKALK